jgi:molybdopterin-biosynthesis enzyme MoeA-like protein
MATSPPKTAAALIIGNEILTGKVQEANVAYLARELFALGVTLQRVVVCTDEVATIAEEINALRHRYDTVFTSGGVGPTLDDLTLPAVAQAFGRPMVRSPEMEGLLRRHFGERLTEAHLRMADLPEGTELVATGEMRWPTVLVDNVWVLPGLPEVFRMKFPIIQERLRAGPPFISRAVYTLCDEGEIAALLERLDRDHEGVTVGSYPVWGGSGYSVKITFDGRDSKAIDRAAEALVAALPADKVVPTPLDADPRKP